MPYATLSYYLYRPDYLISITQVLSNLLSNALKFSTRGSVVTIRAGFKPTTSEEVTTNGVSQLDRPRQGSIQRIKEAIRKGSGLIKNTKRNDASQFVNMPSSRFAGVSVVSGGQSVAGGQSVPSQRSPKDFIGRLTN